MKKIDIIQTTILVIAIMVGYSVVEFFLSLLAALPQIFSPYANGAGNLATRLIVMMLAAIATYLLIRFSRRIAAWLLKNDPDGDTEGAARWDVDRRTLVFALIIGIGLYTMVYALAYAINDLIDFFNLKVAVTSGRPAPSRKDYLVLELLRLTIGAMLVYAAPNLSDFIEKTIAVRLKREAPEEQEGSAETRTDTQPD